MKRKKYIYIIYYIRKNRDFIPSTLAAPRSRNPQLKANKKKKYVFLFYLPSTEDRESMKPPALKKIKSLFFLI